MELEQDLKIPTTPENQRQSSIQNPITFAMENMNEIPDDVSKYDPLIPRKVMEALTGVPVHTLIKYEADGIITPIKTKEGNKDIVCYRIKDAQTIFKKKGTKFTKKDVAEIIAVWSQKGGVGKTAFIQHLAGLLSVLGKVLVIDLDSQGDATQMLGLDVKYDDVVEENEELDPTIAELIDWNLDPETGGCDYRHLPFEQVVKVVTPTLHVIPSDLDLGEINYSLNIFPIRDDSGEVSNLAKFDRIKKVVDSIKHMYDFILFDCPPNIETCNVNALLASNRIIMPCELEAKCLKTMYRNHRFLNRLKDTGVGFNWDSILLVPNKNQTNQRLKAKALYKLEETYGDGERGVTFSSAHLPSSVIIDKCSEEMEPVYVTAGRNGKDHRSYVKPGQEFTNYFWTIIHESLDLEMTHLPFPKEESTKKDN